MARILISSTDVMMIQFIVPHIQYLSTKGHFIDVACSRAAGYTKEGYQDSIKKSLPDNSKYYDITLERNPFSSSITIGYKQIKSIIERNNYDLIWTNEPMMSITTRLAARNAKNNKAKLLYLVHGYHFFKGAPFINWLAYPIEWYMSRYCDAMCMINWVDYNFTKKHFPKVPVYHIDGIGLNVEKFYNVQIDRDEKRKSLGLKESDIAVLSVGELQIRKNHIAIVRAIASLNNPNIKYIICGCGALEGFLKDSAKKLGIENQLILLGHRYDIPEILKAVDIFAHPSQREGLGIASIEAMASGLPIVTSNVQGIPDYSKNGITGFCIEPNDVDGYAKAINALIHDTTLREKMGKNNIDASRKFDILNSRIQVESVIDHVLNDNRTLC